jgi:calcium permeable stress-gated cation channel
MGLQYGWKSFAWVAGIPPFIIVILFKIYITRVFARPFRYYVPTESELRNARVHSERGDVKGNRLEKRFGHPALHAELFTPLLHANMMPLLAQIYRGRLGSEQTKLGEYGGQRMDASVLPGGIRIAGIDQNDLEYDPALYRRDRGELDWDQRSIATALDSTTGYPAGGRDSPAPSLPGYARYLTQGPGADSEIELSRFEPDQQPLLPPTLIAGAGQSSQTLPGYSSPQPPQGVTQYPPPPGNAYHGRMTGNEGYREASTYRPHSRQESSTRLSYYSGRDSPGPNAAGRGAYRQ